MNSKEKYIGLKTIFTKEYIRVLRIWPQTLLPSVITLALYFIIFGKLIGSQINSISGFSYIEFIVPGLIMMAVITNTYANVSSSFFGVKFQKSIEELLVSPLPTWVIIFGYVLGGVFRGILIGALVTIVSLFFITLKVHSIFIILSTVILTSIMFSLAGLLNAIFAKKFDDVSIVPTFVLTPLTYLGGVFYSINALPEIWQTISLANPILYMVNTFRYGFLGISDINIYFAFSMIIFFIIIFYAISYHLLEKGYRIRN